MKLSHKPIKVIINESFINNGIDIPFEAAHVVVREGRMPLYEGEDFIVDHYKLYFSDEFLNNCSMGDTFIIEIISR